MMFLLHVFYYLFFSAFIAFFAMGVVDFFKDKNYAKEIKGEIVSNRDKKKAVKYCEKLIWAIEHQINNDIRINGRKDND